MNDGAPGGVVNVENGTLPLGQLTTDKLAAALRDPAVIAPLLAANRDDLAAAATAHARGELDTQAARRAAGLGAGRQLLEQRPQRDRLDLGQAALLLERGLGPARVAQRLREVTLRLQDLRDRLLGRRGPRVVRAEHLLVDRQRPRERGQRVVPDQVSAENTHHLTGLDAGIPQATRTRLLEPSVEAPVTIVVWYGFTNAPSQFIAVAERLRDAMHKGGMCVALDERGDAWSTRTFADKLGRWRQDGRDVAFVIGGADGLDPGFREAAAVRLLGLTDALGPARGAAGFWIAATASLTVASVMTTLYFLHIAKADVKS